MAVAFRAAQGSNNGTGGTTLTLTKPTGTLEGDMMIAAVTYRGGTNASVSISPKTDLSYAPEGATVVRPDGNYVYALHYTNSRVSCIQTSGHTVTHTPTTGTNPQYLYVRPDSAYVYAANTGANTVSCIRTSDHTVTHTVTCGTYPNGMTSNADSSKIYVANSAASGTVSVIRTSDHTVINTITVGNRPQHFQWSADGAYLYVTNTNSDPSYGTISVIRVSDDVVVASPGLQKSAYPGALTPDGSYFYVPNYSSNSVSVMRASDWTITSTITGFSSFPRSGAMTLDGAYIYYGSDNNYTISVVRTSDNTIFDTISTDVTTNGMLTDPNGEFVYAITQNQYLYQIRVSDNVIVGKVASSTYTPVPSFSVDGSTMYVNSSVSTSYSTERIPAASPWHAISPAHVSTTVLGQRAFWRVAGASEPGSFTANISSSQLASGGVISFSGVDPKAQFNSQSAGQNNASSTSILAPTEGSWSSTSGVDVGMFGTAYTTSITPPTDYTEPTNGESSSTGGSTATTTELAYRLLSGVTTVGSITATAVDAAVNIGFHVFLKEDINFTISADPSVISIPLGDEGAVDIDTTAIGTAETVTFSISGLPANVTYEFDPTAVTAGSSSVLTLTVGGSAVEGITQITVTGTSASAVHSANIALTVNSLPAPIFVYRLGYN